MKVASKHHLKNTSILTTQYMLQTAVYGLTSWIHSFNHSRYFYSASSSALLLRGTPDYSINTVSELTCWNATGNFEWRKCPRCLHGGWSGIWTCNPPDARHRTYQWAIMLHTIVMLDQELDNNIMIKSF